MPGTGFRCEQQTLPTHGLAAVEAFTIGNRVKLVAFQVNQAQAFHAFQLYLRLALAFFFAAFFAGCGERDTLIVFATGSNS